MVYVAISDPFHLAPSFHYSGPGPYLLAFEFSGHLGTSELTIKFLIFTLTCHYLFSSASATYVDVSIRIMCRLIPMSRVSNYLTQTLPIYLYESILVIQT